MDAGAETSSYGANEGRGVGQVCQDHLGTYPFRPVVDRGVGFVVGTPGSG